MNNANGGSVTYHIKGDDSNLKETLDGVKKNIGGLVGISGTIMKGVASASVTAGKALVKITGEAVEAYADVEQSIGGINTIFGEEMAKTVIENAQKAYMTAGVDANTYMQGVANFSARLMQGLGGDAKKASEVADMAFRDMSDNANTFGTDIKSIERAYQSFARGQYTLLDNLKLGYGQTKEEMYRLLDDAEKISGVHYDINNLADVYQAIHVIQENLKITGKTGEEAVSTISGSMKALKASCQNLLSGQGSVEDVIQTAETAGTIIVQNVERILPGVVEGITGLINGLLPLLPGLIQTALPVLVQGTVDLMKGLISIVPELIKTLSPMLPDIIKMLLVGLRDISIALAEAMPEIMPVVIEGLVDALVSLCENVDTLLEASMALIGGLIQGISIALPKLVQQAPKIISAIVKGLVKSLGSIVNVGKNLIEGLWNGIKDTKDWVINKVKGLAKDILKGMTSVLGIHSPSTEFAFLGKMSILGYTEALDDMKGEINDAIQSTFALSPELTNASSLHYSPNVIVNNQVNNSTDPLGQTVTQIKTFANGAKNDFNYGMGW